MPTKPVYRKGKRIGFRWGKHGKIYRSKKKADKQGLAIRLSGWKEK